jgi:hypothetical protein
MSEDILEKWYNAKQELKELENQIEKYKRKIEKELNKEQVEKLSFDDYSVSRKRMSRSYISKESVPKEIWDKYKVTCHFDTYYVKKNKK